MCLSSCDIGNPIYNKSPRIITRSKDITWPILVGDEEVDVKMCLEYTQYGDSVDVSEVICNYLLPTKEIEEAIENTFPYAEMRGMVVKYEME